MGPDRTCVIVPAFDAAPTIEAVVRGAARHVPLVIVVDDGSRDETGALALRAGARVVAHRENRGKGAALRAALAEARALGFDVAASLDADGQHPPDEIPKLLGGSDDPGALVVGVRDLAGAGAPRANQRSNAFSNAFLSVAMGCRLRDTQSGMRRYPVDATLRLDAKDDRFGFEAEVLIRAIRAGLPIVHVDIDVLYAADRTTHFDAARDPWRIVGRVVRTLVGR